ncbi:class I adenylate-forming enzyme family protein [Aliiroseovarius sp. YM-037]|uniref:class I adenylate-forming enzyme family protein n=1 Tax=Aliiroseovarius sp. YM-037 TaxID=3341728 RepID=UPI003A7FC25C
MDGDTTRFRWHRAAHVFDAQGAEVRAPERTQPGRGVINIPETPQTEALRSLFQGDQALDEFCITRMAEPDTQHTPPPIGPALQCLSSGTTGAPRRIRRTQSSWIETFEANGQMWGLGPDDTTALLGALSHSLTLYAALEALWLGADLHLLSALRPDRQLARLSDAEVTAFYATPSQLALFTTVKIHPGEPRLQSVRLIFVGGARLEPSLRAEVQALFPMAEIVEFYGASETSFVTVADKATSTGSVGQPYPGVDLDVRDVDGNPVPPGENGELWVRSPYLFSDYIGSDAADTRWQDGFLSVGEIGSIDGNGNLFLAGRKTRMVTVADQNVFPEQIESHLMNIQGITRAAVLPLPDKLRGNALTAFVHLEDGAPTPAEIISKVRADLGPLATPRSIRVLDDWPCLPSGKTDLQALTALLREPAR